MKTNLLIFSLAFLLSVSLGIAIGFTIFHKKPIPYSPGLEVHRLDSINKVLTDSVKFWKQKQDSADRKLQQLDSIINIQKLKYEKLRKKIAAANSDDSNVILNGFLSE